MESTWSLGGLSVRELLKRTVRESWEDEVFGQAARLAFYHFVAIFPAMLLLLIPLAHLAATGAAMRQMLNGAFRQFLPQQAAAQVTGAVNDLAANARARGALLGFAMASAVWAGINASWAMMVGLNTAYEVAEDRNWREIVKAAAALTLAVLALIFAALMGALFMGPLAQTAPHGSLVTAARWCAIAVVLLVAFALFFRFGPNLKRNQWQWSTPGAVFGALLWVAATLAAGVLRSICIVPADLRASGRGRNAADVAVREQRHGADRGGSQLRNREDAGPTPRAPAGVRAISPYPSGWRACESSACAAAQTWGSAPKTDTRCIPGSPAMA